MRLQFPVKQIRISPVVHMQICRQADEMVGKYVSGQLFGAFLDNEAQVTGILPFPDKLTKEQLEQMERRFQEQAEAFNLDSEKIGWYLVCEKRNFWDQLETMKLFEKYLSTCFFLVLDRKAAQEGLNPYRAFRLKDSFALTENFKWSDLQKTNLETTNPFEEFPAAVFKNDLFQLLMITNKQSILKNTLSNRKARHDLNTHISEFKEVLQDNTQFQRVFTETTKKISQSSNGALETRKISYAEYTQFLARNLQMQTYQSFLRDYCRKAQLLAAPGSSS